MKINSARALDQDNLHACHCAFFGWFNLPCFVWWVIEKQLCLAEEFRFNVNGREMIQCKNTHRWDGTGRRKIAEGHLQEESRCLEHHWSFVFSLLILSLRIVRQIFQTKLYIEESALLWVVHIGAACFSKVTTSVKGCGLRSMSNKMMSNNTVIAWINHKVYQVHSRGCA